MVFLEDKGKGKSQYHSVGKRVLLDYSICLLRILWHVRIYKIKLLLFSVTIQIVQAPFRLQKYMNFMPGFC